jgi:predicted GNAT superfamily acetyltransferase
MATDPWALAHAAADRAGVRLAPLPSLEDADAILAVMIATWGPYQLLPREMIRALAESGNVPYGAFEGSTLVGYVLGWGGVDGEGLHVHSHMLAVLPGRRHGGVGYALKLAQRAQTLGQGIGVVRWTFDPLLARNAWLNLAKLGAIADRFEPNFYGEMTDELNRGERSDRLVIRWDLEREPAPRTLHADAPRDVLVGVAFGDDVRPERRAEPVVGDTAAIHVPLAYPALKDARPELAVRWREAVAEALAACFALGMRVEGFERGAEGERTGRYLLVTP